MNDNTNKKTIILVIVTGIVVLISLFSSGQKANNEIGKIKIVENPSNFYTVNSCIYRYITYLSNGDSKSTMLVVDKDYINKNKINDSNVIELLKEDSNSTFVSQKMYYQDINQNITKYYVYGYIEPNQLFDDTNITQTENKDAYYVVYLDTTNSTFSIAPYDGSIFLDGDQNE